MRSSAATVGVFKVEYMLSAAGAAIASQKESMCQSGH